MNCIPLACRNLLRRPGRTAALIALTAFLAVSVFGGSLVVSALRRGLDSMGNRLGADIIVVPAEAESKTSLKNLLLMGTVGTFYMDASALDKVRETEGVAAASAQVFLASMKADCCSARVQVIGFDPADDFVVQPWISESLNRPLGDMEVVVGCKVNTEVGNQFRIYGQSCLVVAKLAPTGTGLDTAVYCNMNTIRILLQSAEEKGITHKLASGNETEVVSAVYVRVNPGVDAGEVNNRLNGRIRKATAVRTAGMMSEVADSLRGVSGTVALLVAAVWVLALVILLIAYAMMINERKRELAVLRVLGMSRRMIGTLVLTESALCSLAGALAGILAGALLVFPFTNWIENSLGLPWLTPSAGTVILFACGTLMITLAAGCLASLRSALRLSRVEPGNALREGA